MMVFTIIGLFLGRIVLLQYFPFRTYTHYLWNISVEKE